jgi:hypothetical protein
MVLQFNFCFVVHRWIRDFPGGVHKLMNGVLIVILIPVVLVACVLLAAIRPWEVAYVLSLFGLLKGDEQNGNDES